MTVRSPLRALALSSAIALLAGCAGPGPSASWLAGPGQSLATAATGLDPTPRASPSLSPVATSSAVPTPPVLTAEATANVDGIEIHLVLDRNPLEAGTPTWVTVTVRNTTDVPVDWMTDGCANVATVLGVLGGGWLGGADQAGLAERFKSFALEPVGHAGQAYLLIGFTPADHIGRDVGCADLGLMHDLAAGERLVHRARWDGGLGDLPAPNGPVRITASFPRVIDHESDPVEVSLDSWIAGGTPFEFLTPAEAIDATLADQRFSAWLHRAPEGTWINSTHTLDPDAGTWAIGLFRESPAGFLGMVTLDARTGEVLEHRFE